MLFSGDSAGPAGPERKPAGAVEEERRLARSGVLGVGTLACPHCDAPVTTGGRALSPARALFCPYCDHAAPLRDFLSLVPPTRPTRVVVRVAVRSAAAPG